MLLLLWAELNLRPYECKFLWFNWSLWEKCFFCFIKKGGKENRNSSNNLHENQFRPVIAFLPTVFTEETCQESPHRGQDKKLHVEKNICTGFHVFSVEMESEIGEWDILIESMNRPFTEVLQWILWSTWEFVCLLICFHMESPNVTQANFQFMRLNPSSCGPFAPASPVVVTRCSHHWCWMMIHCIDTRAGTLNCH